MANTNHPNRSRRGVPAANPRPEDIRAARAAFGHTQTQAARSIYCTLRAWQQWEAGDRRMHPAMFELYKIKTKQTVRPA